MWCWILSACITYFNVLPSVSTKFKMSILIYEMEMVFAIVLFLWIAMNVIVFEIWKIKERCEMEAIILIENILKSCLFSSYYNLSDVSHDSVNKFLSYLIEKSLVELENSYCIEIGEVGLSHIHFNWKDCAAFANFSLELLLLVITKKFNKIVSRTTSVWIINFLNVCHSNCTSCLCHFIFHLK